MVCDSRLFQGIPCELLLIGPSTQDVQLELQRAREKLEYAGYSVNAEILAGEVEDTLLAEIDRRGAGMLVMGAYGHSRIRHILVGSTTTNLLRRTPVPLLLLR